MTLKQRKFKTTVAMVLHEAIDCDMFHHSRFPDYHRGFHRGLVHQRQLGRNILCKINIRMCHKVTEHFILMIVKHESIKLKTNS